MRKDVIERAYLSEILVAALRAHLQGAVLQDLVHQSCELLPSLRVSCALRLLRCTTLPAEGDIWKLPQPSQEPLFRPLHQHKVALIFHGKDRYAAPNCFFPRRFLLHLLGIVHHARWITFLAPGLDLLQSMATAAHGAAVALGRFGGAHSSPELHQSLVEATRSICVHDRIRQLPLQLCVTGRPWIPRQSSQSRKHPDHVPIHDACPPAERDGGDGGCGIQPHAGNFVEVFHLGRHFAPAMLTNVLCPLQKKPGSPVVAQPGPQLVHLLYVRIGEVLHCRILLHPPQVIVLHGLHPRLLQHDL
mmetsp:Transcript_933/g.2787  ORF Transcript_933/g.2787 Transcript_933/m.2787 type:complete len:303 (+) Transcript_933:1362-2270(+)